MPSKKRSVTPAKLRRTPARQRLADAIAERAKATKAVADTQEAIDRTQRSVWEARDRLEEALAALNGTHIGRRVAAAALAGLSPAPNHSVTEAHARRAQAEEALAAAEAGRERLETTLLDCRRELELADREINRAALAVLADEYPRDLSAKLKATEQRFGELRGVMTYLSKNGALAQGDDQAASSSRSMAETKVRSGIFFPEDQQTATYRAWEQCLQELTSNADTPLPAI